MRRLAIVVGLALAIGSLAPVRGDTPDLAELKAVLTNIAIPAEERARRALEGAASLDQSAQTTGLSADRQTRWSQAIELLDDFMVKNPDVQAGPLIRFQAAVYRWAEGRSLAQQSALAPADPTFRAGAIRALDDSTKRLRAIPVKPAESAELFGQNVRFRLAQSLADRSKLDPEGDSGRVAAEREAMGLLDGSLSQPGLQSFVRLLRSELSTRQGLFGQAQMEIEQAEKLTPPPPAEALLEARVAAFDGRRQYDEARKAIDAAKVSEPFKVLSRLQVELARRQEKPPGRERKEIDDQAFRVAESFRGSTRPEGRRGLMELARAIDEPGADAPPEWWDLLAEGHLRLGNPARAGRLVAKGGDRAEAVGSLDKAASLRYKSGAYLFEAGKFVEADRGLSKVLEAPNVPRDLKAKAGMLRVLARGRAVATREPKASKSAYLEALEAQVRDFPLESSSGEARWLLGQVRLSVGRPEDALTLWSGITHGHPRWLEARLLVADRLREDVEAQRINRDSANVRAKMDRARQSLRTGLEQALEGPELVALTLQQARLELIPDAGRPADAIDACDRVLKGAARTDQHRTARLDRMVALAQGNRAFEAEKAARIEATLENVADLLPPLRLLDRSASEAEAESSRRRFGLISRILTDRLVDHLDQLSGSLKDEARLHHARALLFAGDLAASKKEIADWGGPIDAVDDEILRELADTYHRLDAYVLAIDAERFRSSRLAPGSLPWLESRYGMALAYYRDNQLKEAARIIDATAILHPDLGGGDLKARFERLRQRIGHN